MNKNRAPVTRRQAITEGFELHLDDSGNVTLNRDIPFSVSLKPIADRDRVVVACWSEHRYWNIRVYSYRNCTLDDTEAADLVADYLEEHGIDDCDLFVLSN